MTEAGIQAFYERLLATLATAGVPVVILGGQALLRHRLAGTTKDANYWRVVAERMQTQNTERDLINELVPTEWAPTLAAARRWAAGRGEGRVSE